MISQREADKIAFENDLTGGKYFDLLIKCLNSKIFVMCEFPRNICQMKNVQNNSKRCSFKIYPLIIFCFRSKGQKVSKG